MGRMGRKRLYRTKANYRCHFSGLVNFGATVACQFCLNLPAAFSQPGISYLANPCTIVEASASGHSDLSIESASTDKGFQFAG